MNSFADAFSFAAHHRHLLLQKTGVHMLLSLEAMVIAVALAVPLGLWLGHIHRGSFLAISASNLGRALPSLAILSILLPVIGIGHTDVVIALVVLAFPPILTNTYVAIAEVDSDVVEAAQGMGLRPWQVVARIELPLARHLIFAGVRTAAVFVVATATLAGYFGGGGLGDIIANEASYKLSGVIGASYVIIVLTFASQLLFFGLERVTTPSALRRRNETQDPIDDAALLVGQRV